jgi:GntR family transcriptional regulator
VTPRLPFSVVLHPGEPVAEQVVYAVTRAVVSGQLRPGDPFPSVRTLSHELKINPNTAHRIVAALTEEGLLTVRQGIGTVVCAPAGSGDGNRGLPDDEIERLVVDARRAGLTLQQVIAQVRDHWARTSPRARERRA